MVQLSLKAHAKEVCERSQRKSHCKNIAKPSEISKHYVGHAGTRLGSKGSSQGKMFSESCCDPQLRADNVTLTFEHG